MDRQIPLAEQLRPETLDEYIGQQHLIGPEAILRKAIVSGNLPSMILWGPPGVGKTTLANIIAQSLSRPFYTLSAINSGVKDVREVIEKAKHDPRNSIMFIDEIHRFSKSQQDSLLGAVERGVVTLIGATTENPSFEVISPLLSRCQVYILKSHTADDLRHMIQRAVPVLSKRRGVEVQVKEDEALLRISGGDARKLLNALELVVNAAGKTDRVVLDNAHVLEVIQQNLSTYDKDGEMHYDVISAFIKSIRGSDPNAAVYWLARMLEGGEDIKFIARRLVILASEDVGLANPNALLMANTCFDAVNKIGMPEARIILSQATVYLACSPKSNSTYVAINQALRKVREQGDLPVPLNIRNAPTKLMKGLGYGQDYHYSHDYVGNFVAQEFMPPQLSGTQFYNPGKNGAEERFRAQLSTMWKEKYKY